MDQPIITKNQLKKDKAMEGIQIRLPQSVREQAKALALSKTSTGIKVTETDVYRTAILFFLSSFSTDSRDNEKGA